MNAVKALFQPFFRKDQRNGEDLLGYSHSWVGDRFAQPLRNLKATAASQGIKMESASFSDSPDADIYFFWERPAPNEPMFDYAIKSGKAMVLLATEPDITVSMNFDPGNPLIFDKIFTWRQDLIDSKKYFGIRPITFRFPGSIDDRSFAQRNFCVLLSSLYNSSAPGSLYQQRLITIKWFEAHHIDKLDWYGRRLRNSSFFTPLYKGETSSKQEVMSRYKFCICYESTSAVPGFITEKIFDAFFAGTVPVYWGPEDILSFVPAGCFIDRRQFAGHEELYEYMQNISEDDYLRYRANAAEFLRGDFARSYNEWSLTKAIMLGCFDINVREPI